MRARPPLGTTIVLSFCGAVLAGFSCAGALMVGSEQALMVGGIGFVAGLVLFLVSIMRLLYLTVVRLIDWLAPVPPAAPPPTTPPGSDAAGPPQPPGH